MIKAFLSRAIAVVRSPSCGAHAIDPVCGMEVDPSKVTAKQTAEYGGQTYYFCAPGCRKAFEEKPDRYLSPDYVPSM